MAARQVSGILGGEMTKTYYISKKAEDLMLGNMFVSWFAMWDEANYPKPKRILDIKEKNGRITLHLDDASTALLCPEHIVLVQEIA